MKVLIDLPNALVTDYDADKFHDCFMRFITDAKYADGLAGNYEVETLVMLDEAFKNSEVVNSYPVFFEWNDLYWEEDEIPYIDEDGDEMYDYTYYKNMDTSPEDGEIVAVLTEYDKIDYVQYDGYNFGSYSIEDIKAWAELKAKEM